MRTVTDELGADLQVPDEPRRLVSLVPSLSESLWWFGVADRLVGVTTWCVAPPHGFPHARRVRGTKNPDVGAVADLEPDLVIANEEENRELDVTRLRDAGVAVYVTAPRTVGQAAETLETLGALVGARSPGESLATEIRRALEIASKRAPTPPVRAFVPVWRDPWMATGADTYAGSLLAACGVEVVADGARYPEMPLDDVAAAEPEAVLLPDEPYAFGDEDKAAFADWGAAVRLVDGAALTWYGPRTPTAVGDLTRLASQLRGRARRRRARARRRDADGE